MRTKLKLDLFKLIVRMNAHGNTCLMLTLIKRAWTKTTVSDDEKRQFILIIEGSSFICLSLDYKLAHCKFWSL